MEETTWYKCEIFGVANIRNRFFKDNVYKETFYSDIHCSWHLEESSGMKETRKLFPDVEFIRTRERNKVSEFFKENEDNS